MTSGLLSNATLSNEKSLMRLGTIIKHILNLFLDIRMVTNRGVPFSKETIYCAMKNVLTGALSKLWFRSGPLPASAEVSETATRIMSTPYEGFGKYLSHASLSDSRSPLRSKYICTDKEEAQVLKQKLENGETCPLAAFYPGLLVGSEAWKSRLEPIPNECLTAFTRADLGRALTVACKAGNLAIRDAIRLQVATKAKRLFSFGRQNCQSDWLRTWPSRAAMYRQFLLATEAHAK